MPDTRTAADLLAQVEEALTLATLPTAELLVRATRVAVGAGIGSRDLELAHQVAQMQHHLNATMERMGLVHQLLAVRDGT